MRTVTVTLVHRDERLCLFDVVVDGARVPYQLGSHCNGFVFFLTNGDDDSISPDPDEDHVAREVLRRSVLVLPNNKQLRLEDTVEV